MPRINGKFYTETKAVSKENVNGFNFSNYNYVCDNFTDIHATRCWPMVETIKDCIKSFDKLITKKRLEIL